MSLNLVRVDDRLIHGQVVAVWLRALGGERIVVVDDRTADDEFLRDVLVLASPPGVPVEVHGLAEGVARCLELAALPERVMVIVRTPATALRLREAGVPFDVLNLGGLGAGPGRRRLHKTISASDEELAQLRAIESLGTRVEIQIVPDERAVAFTTIDKGA